MVTKINASHILVKTEQEANVVLFDVTHGKSFEDVAREKSLCPSKKNGGNLGWFTRGKMVKEFENASFSLKCQKSKISDHARKSNDFRRKVRFQSP